MRLIAGPNRSAIKAGGAGSRNARPKPLHAPLCHRGTAYTVRLERLMGGPTAMPDHNTALLDLDWQSLVHPPSADGIPAVRDAAELNATFEPNPDVDYAWIWDYAKDRYSEVMAVRDALDEKAGEIIKYLGGGAGLVTLTAILTVPDKKVYLLRLALPTFLLALGSVFFAVLARAPSIVAFPPTVGGAINYVERHGERARNIFLGQWHVACVETAAGNEIKANRIQAAIRLFYLAVASLLLPFLVAIFC